MEHRALGQQGLEVAALGLGCMGMTFAYSGADDAESRATIRAAVAAGLTMFDTADIYGPYTNEELVGEVLEPIRGQVVIATKFGNVQLPDGTRKIDGSPEHVRRACDGSLRRLRTDVIDLYYLHRLDRAVPIEETVGAMSELVAAGKVRYLGLSEVGAKTIRRAHSVHPISAVQSEYSLWTRDVEAEALATLRELGIGFVAYSPLGRGFLTGAIREREELAQDDSRRNHPRFSEGNFEHNLPLLDAVEAIANRLDATLSQVALAWVLAQGDDIAPIPGTTKRRHLDENLAALDITLSREDLDELRGLFAAYDVAGDRYPAPMMVQLDT
jgi:aryl-alcohol dehydrogenase-like predicted oxidoreductase